MVYPVYCGDAGCGCGLGRAAYDVISAKEGLGWLGGVEGRVPGGLGAVLGGEVWWVGPGIAGVVSHGSGPGVSVTILV